MHIEKKEDFEMIDLIVNLLQFSLFLFLVFFYETAIVIIQLIFKCMYFYLHTFFWIN